MLGSIDGNTKYFIIKTYNPMYKCYKKNKNKLCTSKFIAEYFKDRIITQPGIKLWELADLCKKQLRVRVGFILCRREKLRVM